MKHLILIIFFLLVLVVQAGIFDAFRLFGAVPDLLFLCIAYYTLKTEKVDFLFYAFFFGLILDLFSGMQVGSFALAFLVLTVLINIAATKFFGMTFVSRFAGVIILAASILLPFLVSSFSWIGFRLHVVDIYLHAPNFKAELLPEFFYNLILLWPVIIISDKMFEIINRFKDKNSKFA